MDYLLVDGHSVIFAWPELRALHAQKTSAARDALVKTLTGYQDWSGVRTVVVFDGRGAKANTEGERHEVQIFYSPAGKTADELIERLVAKYAERHRITVATSDRMEQQTVLTFGATGIVSAEGLRGLIEDAERDFTRRLRTHRRKIDR